jgi:hypothetical protein
MRDELAYHGAGKLPGGILESLDFLVNLQVAGIRETATLDGWSATLPLSGYERVVPYLYAITVRSEHALIAIAAADVL